MSEEIDKNEILGLSPRLVGKAIKKAHDIQSSAEEIDGSTLGERKIPDGFDISLLPSFRVWKDRNSGIFKTNIKAERLFSDIESDAVIYVKTTGSDTTGDGSFENPYRTIRTGVRENPTGGKLTVYIEAGTYVDSDGWNSTGIFADSINVIAYNGLVTSVQTVGTSTNAQMQDDKECYIEGIHFDGGKSAFNFTNVPSIVTKASFKNCRFSNAVSENGLNVKTQGIYILENCIADNNFLDGFNYHANDIVDNQLVIEINCQGFSNGSGGTANNGSTIHDEGKIIRVNGEYYGNENRNIHDVNDCLSWNLGVKSYDGQEADEGNFVVGIGDLDTSKMWLDSCTSGGVNNKDIDISGGTASAVAEIYTYNEDFTGGIASTVTPMPYEYNK